MADFLKEWGEATDISPYSNPVICKKETPRGLYRNQWTTARKRDMEIKNSCFKVT
jgi:hypothetical protein